MPSYLLQRLTEKIKRLRRPKPLVSHHEDLRLVRRVRRRFAPRFNQLLHIHKILSHKELLAIRICASIFAVSGIWLIGAVAYQYRTQVPAIGGHYVEAAVGTVELPNPIFSPLNDVDADIVRLIYSGLMRYDSQQHLTTDLASSYEVSPDKKMYTFVLRQDVHWHDGEPFTARDVAFTIDTIQNPAVNSPLLVSFRGVKVTVVNDHTIRFELKEPFAPFLSTLTVGIIPEHIWGQTPTERLRLYKYNLQPVGTGPFQFKRLLKDDTGFLSRYEMIRSQKYYRANSYLDEIAFQFFRAYEGQSGAIQAMREQKVNGLSFVPHEIKEKIERKYVILHTLQLPQYTALFLNQDHAPALKDKLLRAALELALDKTRILHEAIKDEGKVIAGPILSGFPGYTTDTPATPYVQDKISQKLDLAWPKISAADYRALRRDAIRRELETAMVTSTSKGSIGHSQTNTTTINDAIEVQLKKEINDAQTFYRKDKDGNVLAITIVTADTPEYKQAAELIAGFWQEIGVKTTVKRLPAKDIPRLALKNRDYDVLLYGLIIGNDPDQYPFWHSSQIDFPGLNLSRYANHSLDTLLQQARETTNPDELSGIYKKIQDMILADRPAIFLYTPTYTYATADEVHGITDQPIFHPSDRFDSVSNWYIKTKGKWNFKP